MTNMISEYFITFNARLKILWIPPPPSISSFFFQPLIKSAVTNGGKGLLFQANHIVAPTLGAE